MAVIKQRATQLPPKPAPVAEAVVEPMVQAEPQPSTLKVRTGDGVTYLRHPYTGQEFAGETEIETIDSWVQSQLDANKLVQC